MGHINTACETNSAYVIIWATPSLLRGGFRRVLDVRSFGEVHQLPNLTVPQWPATEVDGWEMAAVAAKVVGAQGAYRTPGDASFPFLLLMNLRHVH